ncbi:hypothetical protein DL96DRAFT_1822473 [Flagelloscypha sp. PMI_526]|nr:hypothetical protein DL96DRAFT_1822473 [Flagelloscypha sp. PMI_526]
MKSPATSHAFVIVQTIHHSLPQHTTAGGLPGALISPGWPLATMIRQPIQPKPISLTATTLFALPGSDPDLASRKALKAMTDEVVTVTVGTTHVIEVASSFVLEKWELDCQEIPVQNLASDCWRGIMGIFARGRGSLGRI